MAYRVVKDPAAYFSWAITLRGKFSL